LRPPEIPVAPDTEWWWCDVATSAAHFPLRPHG
jgi:hypothetical protein